MSSDAAVLAPGLLAAALFLGLAPLLDKADDRARTAIVLAAFGFGLRYLLWRLTETVLPFDGTIGQRAWVWTVFALEGAAFIDVAVFLLIMSRGNRLGDEADRRQAEMVAGGRYPSVDVLIPTFNEGLEVIEKTIIGAMAMDYPSFSVHVLDDGKRPWLARLCAVHGVAYVTRPDNRHAKAGNLNHALKHCDGELVAVLDADFVPARAFLTRTAGFFADPAIGIVQTPQHFFNKDPVQMNLLIANDWPDEQRLFFDEMAASRDAWGAAFCCGSCSVTRRAALDAVGGFPTASITEDLLTTLVLRRAGWRTRYLNERLSLGLAAESLQAFFVQRARWCQGGIQSLFLAAGPLGPGLKPLERVLFLPLSWLVQYPVRLMTLLVPVVYLLTGVPPLHFTSAADVAFYQLPVFIAHFGAMYWLVGRKYAPLLSSAVGVFATFRLLPTVLASLVRPFGKTFQVTPKGALADGSVDWFTFACVMTMLAATICGIAVNLMPETQVVDDPAFFPVAAAWAGINALTLLLAGLICFDAPRKRKEERFTLDVPADLAGPDGPRACTILDLSLTGARLALADPPESERVVLRWPPVGELPARVVRAGAGGMTLVFATLAEPVRVRLIAELFSGLYTTGPADGHTPRLVRNLVRRVLGQQAA